MTERSKQIFGNDIAPGAYEKQSGRSRNLFVNSGMTAQKIIQPRSRQILISDRNLVSLISAWEKKELRTFIRRKGIIVGNIRMGFGHYRISMAIASAAHALGYEPYWMDLNSYGQTTCTKVIGAQNDLYSMGSRLSQKSRLFNRLVWEPMNYEGFRKLTYNAADQKNAELMAPVYANIPKRYPGRRNACVAGAGCASRRNEICGQCDPGQLADGASFSGRQHSHGADALCIPGVPHFKRNAGE